MIQKTTDEIRALLRNAELDFESVMNKALNAYLPRIFHSCPFSEDICTKKQCIECEIFKNSAKKWNYESTLEWESICEIRSLIFGIIFCSCQVKLTKKRIWLLKKPYLKFGTTDVEGEDECAGDTSQFFCYQLYWFFGQQDGFSTYSGEKSSLPKSVWLSGLDETTIAHLVSNRPQQK